MSGRGFWGASAKIGLVLTALIAMLFAPASSISAVPAPASRPDAIGELAACVRSTGVLEALLLFDTSASLRETDPSNRRIVAANAALTALSDLVANGSSSNTAVDVRLAQFSVDYVPGTDWQSLNSSSVTSLQEQASTIASENNGIDTDFTNALVGARADLADRAAAIKGNDGQAACEAIFLFTDGKFDVEPRVNRLANAPGVPKAYAPNQLAKSRSEADEIIAAGKDAVCRVSGVADEVRVDGVTTIAIALSGTISADDQEFLGAVAEGQVGGTTCGDPVKARGAYVAADDLGALIGAFNRTASQIAGGTLIPGSETVTVCTAEPCAEGTREFRTSRAMSRVTALVDMGRAEGSVVVRAPNGSTAPLTASSPNAALGGATITSRWFDSHVSSLNIQFDDHVASEGAWAVTLVSPIGGSAGRVQLFAYTDLRAQLLGDPEFRIGMSSDVSVELTSDSGNATDRLAGSRSTVTLSASNPSAGEPISISMSPTSAGRWTGSWSVPDEWNATETLIATQLAITSADGFVLEPVVRQANVAVKKPASYPQISTKALRLGTVEGKGHAKGTVDVTGGTQPGCVGFGEVDYSIFPSKAPTPSFESPVHSGECISVKPGETRKIPVSFNVSRSASGSVRASLPVTVSSEADQARPLTTDIPVSFETKLAVDRGTQVLLMALLLIIGLGVPFVLLYLLNWKSALYGDLDFMRGIRLPLLVHPDGFLEGIGEDALGAGTAPTVSVNDWSNLGDAGRKKSFEWSGIRFETSLPRFPIGEPFGVASCSALSYGDFAPGQRGTDAKIGLGLLTSWVIIYRGESASERRSIDAPDVPANAVNIEVVLFAHAGTEPQRVRNFLTQYEATIAAVARKLASESARTNPDSQRIPVAVGAMASGGDDELWDDDSASTISSLPIDVDRSHLTNEPESDDSLWDD